MRKPKVKYSRVLTRRKKLIAMQTFAEVQLMHLDGKSRQWKPTPDYIARINFLSSADALPDFLRSLHKLMEGKLPC